MASDQARLQAGATYGLPFVGRYGLSHSLLAWARCELWCRDHAVPMLAPNWNHLRVGPYLRREADKREYHRLFRFPHYITGLRRSFLLLTLPRVAAPSLPHTGIPDFSQRQIVVFENRNAANFEHHFPEVAGRASELQGALRNMTKPRHLPPQAATPHIAVHVRLGDFTPAVSGEDLRKGMTNASLPAHWYAETLQRLRTQLGRDVPAVVYSDGDDQALATLLGMPQVRRATARAAVTDMLSIAQAAVLISSGSGFSIWGAFLGHVPRLCFPGQRLVRALGPANAVDLEPEIDFNQPIPENFLSHVAHGLG